MSEGFFFPIVQSTVPIYNDRFEFSNNFKIRKSDVFGGDFIHKM